MAGISQVLLAILGARGRPMAAVPAASAAEQRAVVTHTELARNWRCALMSAADDGAVPRIGAGSMRMAL